MSMPLTGQDWETVVLSKPKNHSSGGSNPHKPPVKLTDEQIRLNKLENEEIVEQKKVPLELRKKIQQARGAKKMTQAQLAQKVNVKQNVINEYENGKAVPDNALLGKLERALGVKLRGKNI
jgi:putative transcription factor